MLSISCSDTSLAPKERPKSGDSLPSWFIKGGDKGRIYPSSAFSSTGASAYPTFPSSIKPKSLMGNESPNVESSPSPSPAPEEISQKLFQVPSADEQRQITQEGVGEVTTDEISRPRKVLLSEIDMRGVVVTPSLSSPKAENSNYMKMKRNQNSVPFPHSAVFIVRIYDVGRTIVPISSPHTKNEAKSKCYSSGHFLFLLDVKLTTGLVVESKMLPETEKSMAYELFLPLKQLKLLVDNQPSSIYDSLGRKLRRLKCINRETGLW